MINSQKARLFLAFLFALLPALIIPIVLPWLRLTFFAPFLSLLFYKSPLTDCLWYSLVCGVVMDLLSAHTRLGLYVINYCLTTGMLFNQKRHLFEDKVTTLPIMTFLFAVVSTILQAVILKSIGSDMQPSWQWALTDLLLFPLADALYALVWFAVPAYLLRRKPQNRDNTLNFKNS